MLCLAKNPEKQDKLREEILRILPNKDSEFTQSAVADLPYLRGSILEALRLYPVTIDNVRAVQNDVVLSGYQVPKDTEVTMINMSLLQSDEYFPNANEFLPERWIRTKQKSSSGSKQCPNTLRTDNPFVHLPFGHGPRSCIGRRIAEMQMKIVFARIIRNFKVEYNYSTENAFRHLLISIPNIPLKFKFTDIP